VSTHAVAANAHTGEVRTAAERTRRVRINRFGLWLFFISDGLLFGIMAAARFAIADTHVDEEISQVLGLGITGILLASSLTAYLADAAISNGNIRRGQMMFLVTIVLGAIFLGGVVVEWSIAEFSASEPYGTAFFSMTGMHATHVATGLLFLMLAWVLAHRGRFNDGNTFGAQGVVMYWHFVDVVWVFFYPILYLLQ
jgi:cytochrome c oxidase subunit 3